MSTRRVRIGPHRSEKLTPMLRYFPDVWGVYVGDGCVSRLDPLEWREVDAHAHVARNDPWRGWICIADPRRVITVRKNPTHLLLHEVAHIIRGNHYHDNAWKAVVSDLGASREAASYVRGRRIR